MSFHTSCEGSTKVMQTIIVWLVSKATNVTARAAYRLRGGIGDGEQMSVKMGREDSDRGWGGDVLRQTVPHTSSGDRKSLVIGDEPSSRADSQWWRRGGTKSLTTASCQSSLTRYEGADQWRHLYTRTAHLKTICSGAFILTGLQWASICSGMLNLAPVCMCPIMARCGIQVPRVTHTRYLNCCLFYTSWHCKLSGIFFCFRW